VSAVPAREAGGGDGRDDGTALKEKRLDDGGQNAVGVCAGIGSVLKRSVA